MTAKKKVQPGIAALKTRRTAGAGKVNNAGAYTAAKVEIRRNAINELGGPTKTHVFDAFAGEGVLWRGAYRDCASYVGCDKTWYRDERPLYVADNLRVMRAVDLAPFNLFDLDAYGSPWKQWLTILARRQLQSGERVAVILTEGTATNLIMRRIDGALAEAAGISSYQYGAKRRRFQIVDRAIKNGALRWKARLVKRWQVDSQLNSRLSYIALVFERP